MSVSLERFVQNLTQSGLMSAADIASFQDSFPPDKRPRDAQTLVTALYRAGKLTKYQAKAVYEGRGKSLVFGEYTVLDQIGEGGMGVVLKAQHRRMDRLVAIKVLSSAAMKQAGAVERFQREVKAAARLEHPNIVTAHDAGEHEGVHYLAMQYVDGKDLATLVKDHGPLEVRQAVEYILQAAGGLQYAHEQGIVHRDIKPGNLLLDKRGTVKILDMGLARITGAEAALGGAERLTTTGQVMGTCDYMAPEQSLDTHQADARADIYSLGCTLFRLLTGNPPYKGETFAKLFLMHLEAPIPSLCEARPEVPEALDAICHRMLAKKPEDRYQSMAEVVAELEALLAVLSGRSAAAATPGDEPSSEVVARTLAFLQEASPRGTLTRQKKPTAPERTQSHVAPEHDTTLNILGKWRRAVGAARRRPRLLLGIGGGLVLLLVVLVVLNLRQGTLVVEIDEHLGKDVHVAVSQGGEKVQVADAKSGWTLSLSPGKYDLAVQVAGTLRVPSAREQDTSLAGRHEISLSPGADGTRSVPATDGTRSVPATFDADDFQLDSHTITVTRGGQVKVKVTLKPAPLAVAPFDAQQARNFQDRWARQLGVPVEMTNSIGMKLVLIPPGEFMMGSPKELIEEELRTPGIASWYKERLPGEGPQHQVRITRPFYLGTYLVTQGEYQRVMGVNPSEFSAAGKSKDKVAGQETKRFPVECVSWDDAVEFCRRLSEVPEEKAAGRWYRLPSEAQWEYACRAGSTGRYGFSSGRGGIPKEYEEHELSEYGWFNGNSGGMPHAVGGKRPSAWGLYDMQGNVWEWCQDRYDVGYYVQTPVDDPTGPLGGSYRMPRGGSWYNPAWLSRSAYRDYYQPGRRINDLGFRVSLVLADGAAERAKPPTELKSQISDLKSQIPNPASSSPPPAVTPFDAQKAKEHQAAWAKHLGRPVELTNSVGMKLVLIPPGEFMMGEGGDAHKVKITKPFYLGKYKVTQEEWEAVMGTGSNPSAFKGPKNPVETVMWWDCQTFLKKLTEKGADAGGSYRLPTEAQWEYACRAGSTGGWCFGDSELGLDDYGWYQKNSEGKTHPVGQKKPNGWGLFDVYGNVWEWCADWYGQDYYKSSPGSDPTGPPSGSKRMFRGGGWYYPAERCRSAGRDCDAPEDRVSCLGFRASLVLADTAAERAKPPTKLKSQISDPKSQIPNPESLSPPPAPAPPLVRVIEPSKPKPETPPPQAAAKPKLPVPDDAAQTQARKAADALFKTEIQQAKTAADKVALAKRLLAQALDQTGDTAGQYVLMLGAKDLAATARDAETAFQVIDKLAEIFDVDRFAMKTDILTDWAKEARALDTRKWVVEQVLAVGDEAVDAGNLEAAKELGTLATRNSGGLRDKNLTLKLKAYRQRFLEAGKEIEELQEARAALAKDPKDPTASLVLGRYLCFSKGDWEKGLALLAQGSDASLKGLADLELKSPPKQPDEQVKLGDAWWEIAPTRSHSQMNAIKIHAGRWYRQADAALTASLVKNNVEKRLAEVRKLRSQLPSPPPAIAPFAEKKAKEHQRRWAEYLGVPAEITNSIGMKLLLIPPGEFQMGSPKELIEEELKAHGDDKVYQDQLPAEAPQHRVRITKPFYLGTYLVTQGEYQRVMGVNPSHFSATGKGKGNVAGEETKRFPVECVSWDDAVEFCRKLSEIPEEKAAGWSYRLPSEAQWEHACRAGSQGKWHFGNDEARLGEYGWFKGNAGGKTHRVGQLQANPFGLYDIYGNVWEWCADRCHDKFYAVSPVDDPCRVDPDSCAVARGGTWQAPAGFSRSAFRSLPGPGLRWNHLGFRASLALADK